MFFSPNKRDTPHSWWFSYQFPAVESSPQPPREVEGTAPAPLTRFGGPRILSGFDSDNTTTLDTPGVTTGDTYLRLDFEVRYPLLLWRPKTKTPHPGKASQGSFGVLRNPKLLELLTSKIQFRRTSCLLAWTPTVAAQNGIQVASPSNHLSVHLCHGSILRSLIPQVGSGLCLLGILNRIGFSPIEVLRWFLRLYLDTTVLQLGQTYALCVDFDGSGAMELGDAGRRVYVTGVYGFAEHGVIKKATGQPLGAMRRAWARKPQESGKWWQAEGLAKACGLIKDHDRVYMCICVFVYMCICVYMYICMMEYVNPHTERAHKQTHIDSRRR